MRSTRGLQGRGAPSWARPNICGYVHEQSNSSTDRHAHGHACCHGSDPHHSDAHCNQGSDDNQNTAGYENNNGHPNEARHACHACHANDDDTDAATDTHGTDADGADIHDRAGTHGTPHTCRAGAARVKCSVIQLQHDRR